MDAQPASGPPAIEAAEAPVAPSGRRRDAWLVFALALLVLLLPCGLRDLWDSDEGRYAAVALDMRRSGDFVTPREDGMRFLDKPPLLYWAENAAFVALGTNALAARLPCVVAGSLLAVLAFLFASAWARSRLAGFAAAGVMATSVAGVGFSRTVTMDMPLSAAIGGALWFGWRALSDVRVGPRIGLGVCVGLGLLAKGPIAGVVPALVAIAWGLVGVPWRAVARVLLSPIAWLVALLVAAPWYALCERANPGYLRHFLVHEHFGRYAEKAERGFAPVWLYVAVLPLFLLPWTHLLVRARIPTPAAEGRKGPVSGTRLAWAWVVACLLFFSGGRNRLYTYILPAALPLFVLAGARLAWLLEAGRRGAALWPVAIQGFLVLAVGLAFFTGAATAIVEAPNARRALEGGGHAALGVVVILAGLLLASVALVMLYRSLRSPGRALGATLLRCSLFFLAVEVVVLAGSPDRSSRGLAEAIAKEGRQGDSVVCLDVFPQGLRWYRDIPFAVAGKQSEIVKPWADLDGEGRLFDESRLRELWATSRRVLLVVREAKSKPWLDAGGRTLAKGLSGAQRSDLLLIENAGRPPAPP